MRCSGRSATASSFHDALGQDRVGAGDDSVDLDVVRKETAAADWLEAAWLPCATFGYVRCSPHNGESHLSEESVSATSTIENAVPTSPGAPVRPSSLARLKWRMQLGALASALMLAAGCSASTESQAPDEGAAANEPATATVAGDPTAAGVRYVLTKQNSFGASGNPFTRVSIDPVRMDDTPLSAAESEALKMELADLGDVQVSPAKPKDPSELPSVSADEARMRVGPVLPTDQGVSIQISLGCGSTCGSAATYELSPGDDGEWTVTGTDGPVTLM